MSGVSCQRPVLHSRRCSQQVVWDQVSSVPILRKSSWNQTHHFYFAVRNRMLISRRNCEGALLTCRPMVAAQICERGNATKFDIQ